METKANHIMIGAFVIALVAAGFGFLYWLKGTGAGRGAQTYAILFEGSVKGLAQAGDVLFNGLKVGKVRSLAIDPADTRRIRVLVDVRPDTPIRENSRAGIVSRGLTGFAAVQITPGTPDSPLLVARSGEPYPLIKADSVKTQSLMEVAPQVLGNANAVFARINDLLANNEDSIRRAVRNVEEFTAALSARKGDVDTIITNARRISDQLRTVGDVLGKVERVATSLDGLISANSEAIGRTIANAEEFTAALKDKGKDVAVLIDEARDAATGLRKLTARLEGLPEVVTNANKMIARIDGLVEKNAAPLSKTIENVRAFSDTLAANKDEVDAIIKDARILSGQLKTVANKMASTLDQVSALLGDENGKSFLAEAREAVSAFRDLAVKLERTIGDGAGSLTRQAKRGLKEFEMFMRDGRRAARSLDRVLTKIEQNPQSLIFGGSSVPEYNPTQ